MDCEAYRKSIVLMLCDELQDHERAALEAHLRECFDCQGSFADERRVLQLMESAPAAEPSEDLLESCRRDLRAALGPRQGGRPAPARPWMRLWPAWAFTLLAAGFAAGRLYPGVGGRGGAADGTTPEAGTTIANVDFRDSDPRTERISLTYDTLRRIALEGTVGDPRIRQVLLETVKQNRNAGLRLEAIEALRRHADDPEVRRALLGAVREDDNPGARLKALEALQGRAAGDPEVRGAIVQALLHDTNPGVRVRAIDALKGERGPETLAVLKHLADGDPNDYVRLRSAALVNDMSTQDIR
jgi:HEAT repeat protein